VAGTFGITLGAGGVLTPPQTRPGRSTSFFSPFTDIGCGPITLVENFDLYSRSVSAGNDNVTDGTCYPSEIDINFPSGAGHSPYAYPSYKWMLKGKRFLFNTDPPSREPYIQVGTDTGPTLIVDPEYYGPTGGNYDELILYGALIGISPIKYSSNPMAVAQLCPRSPYKLVPVGTVENTVHTTMGTPDGYTFVATVAIYDKFNTILPGGNVYLSCRGYGSPAALPQGAAESPFPLAGTFKNPDTQLVETGSGTFTLSGSVFGWTNPSTFGPVNGAPTSLLYQQAFYQIFIRSINNPNFPADSGGGYKLGSVALGLYLNGASFA
jgi:hypothetical protein